MKYLIRMMISDSGERQPVEVRKDSMMSPSMKPSQLSSSMSLENEHHTESLNMTVENIISKTFVNMGHLTNYKSIVGTPSVTIFTQGPFRVLEKAGR